MRMKRRIVQVSLLLIMVFFMLQSAVCVTKRKNDYHTCLEIHELENGLTFLSVEVCDMENKRLEKKINENMNQYAEAVKVHSPKEMPEYDIIPFSPVIQCQSFRYLSIKYPWLKRRMGGSYEYIWNYCITVDIETGDVVYLDDLVDLNEFAVLLKYGRVTQMKESMDYPFFAEERSKFSNDNWTYRGIEEILNSACAGWTENMHKEPSGTYGFPDNICDGSHYFYLKEGKLYIQEKIPHLLSIDDDPWIDVADMEDCLKVEPW